MLVYGYLPLMVSAQCIFENTGGCRKNQQDESKKTYLTDRLQKKFHVRANCKSCYNIIYNGQSLSLLKYLKEIKELNPRNLRLDFTLESSNVMDQVLQLFIDAYLYGKDNNKEIPEYTTGHFKRGVE
jgi:putative protease